MLPGLQQQIGDTKQQLAPGIGYLNDVLGGKFLGQNNPYTQGMIDQTANNVGNRINSTFSMAGRTGGGNNVTDLARGLGQAENQLRYTDYANERGAMGNAAGMLPGLTSAQYAGYTPYFAGTQLAGQLPYYGAQALSGVGGLYGGYGTQTGKQPGGWGNDILNAGIAALPFVLSEPAAKTNLVRIGDWDSRGDGLGKWQWNWKMDPTGPTQTGVRADEVEQLRPWALGPYLPNGWRTVNYAKLGEA